jgi:hypothetical protein
VFEDQLIIGKVIIDRIAKFLLHSILELELNIRGKIVALGDQVNVTIETQSEILSPASSSRDDILDTESVQSEFLEGSVDPVHASQKKPKTKRKCALQMHAEFKVMDLFEDSLALEQSIKTAFQK